MHTRSSACPPAVAIGNRACNGDFRTQSRQHVAQRGAAGVSPPWRSRIALAKALPQAVRRLPPLHGRASLPMRYPNHGGLTPTALDARRRHVNMRGILVAGTFPDHHGGLTATAPVASVRPPAQLRLLRCTNTYTPRAADVSPPWRSRIALAMAISEHNHGNTSRNEERRMSARRGHRESRVQKRYRNCPEDCRPACWRPLVAIALV